MISTEKKSKIIADLQADKKDTGSSAVQVGVLTEAIPLLRVVLTVASVNSVRYIVMN